MSHRDVDINIRILPPDQPPQVVVNLQPILEAIQRLDQSMSEAMDKLQAEVNEMGTTVDSALAAFAGIRQQLADAIAANAEGDTSKLTQLAADLDSHQSRLARAVANTPDPTPAPPVEEPAPTPQPQPESPTETTGASTETIATPEPVEEAPPAEPPPSPNL